MPAQNTQVLPKDTAKKVMPAEEEEGGDTFDKRIVYGATDTILYDQEAQKLYLVNEAYFEYETMSLKAKYIVMDYASNTVTAYGDKDSLGKPVGVPVFKDRDQEFSSEKIIYNLKTKKGKIFNVLTKQGELLVFGQEIKKDSNDIIYMKNLRCIPCQFEDAKTVFQATRAKIIPNDKVVTGPMYLKISEVPTPLALPFGFFPNTRRRHSGILMPFYGDSQNQGFYLRDMGFYWGISDRHDMTFRGDIYSTGSWGLRVTDNYNIRYKHAGTLTLGYSNFHFGEKEIPSQYTTQRDLSLTWRHVQDNKSNPSIRFSSDVNVRTQHYNQFNSQNTGQYLTNTFQSNVVFSKQFRSSSLSINARHNQNTVTGDMELSFPELTYNVTRFFPFKNENHSRQNIFDKLGVNYMLEARNTLKGNDSTIFKNNIGDSLKYGIRHTLPISTNFNLFKYFTVTPSLNTSAVMYTKTTTRYWNPTLAQLMTDTARGFKTGFDANFSTALTTKVYMDYMFKGKRLKQIRHLLIPTISYTYRPNLAGSFNYYQSVQTATTGVTGRFSIFDNTIFGGPTYGLQNLLSVNLNNTLDAKVRQSTDSGYTFKKVNLLQNVGITGNYNFAADSLKMSQIGITARTKLWKFFDMTMASTFDPYVYDRQQKRVVNRYYYGETGKLARFTGGQLAINAVFSSGTVNTKAPPKLTNGAERNVDQNEATTQERLPWNLNVYYTLSFVKPDTVLRTTQALNFSGDIKVTKYWKIGITSGYDFVHHALSFTRLNLYRDLRCWEFRVDWIPFGQMQSYNFSINMKTSMLRDLKVQHGKLWFDTY